MSGMAVDVAVIGFSVAGVAAALESSSLGREVALFEHSWDNIPLVESVLIGPTPLTGEVATGPGFEEAARRACAELGVTFHAGRIVAAVDRARDGGFLLASTEEVTRAEAIVFAPNGAVALAGPRFEPMVGRGVSLSAWDDAVSYRGQAVAVVGGGIRALEAAYVVSRWAERATVLCPTPAVEAEGLLAKVSAERDNIDILYRADVEELLADGDGDLQAVRLRVGARQRTLPIRGLVVAGEPVIDWALWPTESAARQLAAAEQLFLAGIAAGIAPADHAALYSDGRRAAWACSTAT